jgi:hypothetical protein
VGLIARTIESARISTTCISLTKYITESIGVPRSLFIKWPLGHPLGEPHKQEQQRTIIFDALRLLITEKQAGNIYEPGYRWKREEYQEPNWDEI